MLRSEITAERLHQGQVVPLPGRFGLVVTRKWAPFRCTQLILW